MSTENILSGSSTSSILSIPSESECLEIMEKYKMLPNIIEHSIQVKNVSIAIANNLIDKSSINMELICAGALLHDIAKTITLKSGERFHDKIGANIIMELGYPQVAEICANHVYLDSFNPNGNIEEREIVHYSDKRVKHSKIVSLEERFEDLLVRYGSTEKSRATILENQKFLYLLDEKINRHSIKKIDEILLI
jgi:putative nucleotidyltransferase with HDIG domain